MIILLSCSLLLISFICTHLFCQAAKNSKLVNKPNNRTLHVKPTVRGGGLIFIGLSLCSIPFLAWVNETAWTNWFGLFLSVFLLASISFFDDLNPLSTKSRLIIQCISALIILYFYGPQQLDFVFFSLTQAYIIIPLSFLTIIWSINHFNFMDGLDGFSTLQAVFLLACYFVLFQGVQASFYQDFCLILVAALLGFLYYNFPPAKLFMGDIGSASLGLILITLALIGQQKYQIPLLYWFMLNSLFLFDSTITLIRRFLNHETWYAPHKKHAYQRLKQYGLNTRIILLGQLILNIFIVGEVILLIRADISILSALSTLILVLIVTYIGVERLYPMVKTK